MAQRYRAIDVASLAIAAACSAFLARRIARRLGLHDRVTLIAIGVAATAALIVLPHGLRLALSVPVLVDEAGIGMGLLWILLFTSKDRILAAASIPAALLTVATREVWAIVIVISCVIGVIFGRRIIAIANAAAGAAAFVWVTHRPVIPGSRQFSNSATFHGWWTIRFSTSTNERQMLWAAVFAVGLIPLVFVYRLPIRWLWSELRDGDLTATVLLVSGVLLVGSSPFVGADSTRLAYPGGVLLITVALPWLAADRRSANAGVVLAAASIFVWAPASRLIATTTQYNAFYYPWSRTSVGLVVTATAAGAGLLVFLLSTRFGRSQPAGS